METTKNLKNHELPELERKGFFRRWHYIPTQMAVSKQMYYFIADDYDDLKACLEKHQFNDLKNCIARRLTLSNCLCFTLKTNNLQRSKSFVTQITNSSRIPTSLFTKVLMQRSFWTF